jgi:hypothetical protein
MAGILISLKQLMSRHMLEKGGDAGGAAEDGLVGARDRAGQRRDFLRVGLERRPVGVELHLAREPQPGEEPVADPRRRRAGSGSG